MALVLKQDKTTVSQTFMCNEFWFFLNKLKLFPSNVFKVNQIYPIETIVSSNNLNCIPSNTDFYWIEPKVYGNNVIISYECGGSLYSMYFYGSGNFFFKKNY